MKTATHAITSLWLENFRNYDSLRLTLEPKPVVLMGPNGVGKTNVLEAISLFSPGKGLRGATLRDIDRHGITAEQGFTVSATITHHGEPRQIGTARDTQAARDMRILKIDGEKVGKQAKLTEVTSMLWLTPAMDQLFISGQTARRKWIDRLVYAFDVAHAARVSAYEHAMRERNQMFKKFASPDPQWLDVLERDMAAHGVAIIIARQQALARIHEAMETMPGIFPKAAIAITGETEELLAKNASALEAEEALKTALYNNRNSDARAGRALKGAHKSQVDAWHLGKNIKVEQGSTGEQKAVLLSVMMATALAREAWSGAPPILLFDEVVAHLDVEKQNCLFDLIAGGGIQAWLTGTDASDFSNLVPHATVLKIEGGNLHSGK